MHDRAQYDDKYDKIQHVRRSKIWKSTSLTTECKKIKVSDPSKTKRQVILCMFVC